MMILLYILLGVSILAPIYTYALYPFVLRLFHMRSRSTIVGYCPSVSVVVIGGDETDFARKKNNIQNSDYKNIIEIVYSPLQENALRIIKTTKGEVVVVTDTYSVFLKETIPAAINALSVPWTGCVSGMLRKEPDENGVSRDGANWRYENKIKMLESNIGCLSGANSAIYAVKHAFLPDERHSLINLDFLIPMCVTEIGFDVVFEPKSVAYESENRSEADLFKKHVLDGESGFRSIVRFLDLLWPTKKGSFVFWSHRVMKWLVPFNMIILLAGCGILAFSYKWTLILLLLQILGYLYLSIYYITFTLKGKSLSGAIGKLSDFGSYFLVLNVAWFLGFIKVCKLCKQ